MGTKYFDAGHKRLIYVSAKATEAFWDAHWRKVPRDKLYRPTIPRFSWIVSETSRFLPKGSTILEGGCGLATPSWYLHLAGYKTVALDFAPETVSFLKDTVPDVNPILGDVKQIPMADHSVDGYWSLGVIEHFFDGYTGILDEARRVIKPGGYLFLTFPHLSPLRRWKAKVSAYPAWTKETEPSDFYQFALDKDEVVKVLAGSGFTAVHSRPLDGFKGLKDEISAIAAPLQKIYDSPSIAAKIAGRAIDMLCRSFSSHSVLVVARKS